MNIHDARLRMCERIIGSKVFHLRPVFGTDIVDCHVAGGKVVHVDTSEKVIVSSSAYRNPNRAYIYDHDNKSKTYRSAMLRLGYSISGIPEDAGIVFTDIDAGMRSQRLIQHRAAGATVIMYPHSARPPIWKDGMCDTVDGLSAMILPTETHAEIARRVGYHDVAFIVAGWGFCDILAFRPAPQPRRALFMPIHPNANGFLSKQQKEMNRAAYDILYSLHRAKEIELTVRYLVAMDASGLPIHGDVRLVRGRPDHSTAEIDAADIVIASHTAAFIAVARGTPTLTIGDHLTPISGNSDDTIRAANNWSAYKDLMVYPYDILQRNPLSAFGLASASETDELLTWKERMIGSPFTDNALREGLRLVLDKGD